MVLFFDWKDHAFVGRIQEGELYLDSPKVCIYKKSRHWDQIWLSEVIAQALMDCHREVENYDVTMWPKCFGCWYQYDNRLAICQQWQIYIQPSDCPEIQECLYQSLLPMVEITCYVNNILV